MGLSTMPYPGELGAGGDRGDLGPVLDGWQDAGDGIATLGTGDDGAEDALHFKDLGGGRWRPIGGCWKGGRGAGFPIGVPVGDLAARKVSGVAAEVRGGGLGLKVVEVGHVRGVEKELDEGGKHVTCVVVVAMVFIVRLQDGEYSEFCLGGYLYFFR